MMRTLFVHCEKGNLGDAIRANQIHRFLRKKGFKVHEKWVKIGKLKAFLLGATGLWRIPISQKENKGMKLKSPIEVLVDSSFSSIQQQILKGATMVRPHVIVAEGSLAGYLSLMAKNNLNIPLITDVHGLLGEESKLRGSRYAQILSSVEKITFHESDYLLTVSRPMKRQICLKQKVQADKVLVVPNGGNVQRFQARLSFPLNVIYAGNFAVYEKVSDYLEIAKAVEQTSPFVFFLMGDGVQKRETLSRINKEKIPINFMGLKTRQEALRIFSEMQVGVVTSTSGLEREVAFPIKVLDYMSCGLPIVAPNIGEWGELIEKENCGIAIKENSVAEFVKALYALCDKEEWTKKSRNGKKCIKKKYNWDLVLEPLGALIENIAT